MTILLNASRYRVLEHIHMFKTAASSNFGNVFSILVASAWLSFGPVRASRRAGGRIFWLTVSVDAAVHSLLT